MKNLLSFSCFLLLFLSNAQAGFWGTLITAGSGAYIGGNMAGGAGCHPAQEIQTRATKVNNALWEMHTSGVYDDEYKLYLEYLEKSDEFKNTIKIPDTVAWIYFDFENYKKAVEVYEKSVVPWIKFEEYEEQQKYRDYYAVFKEAKACYFNCDSIVIRAKEERQGKGNLQNYEVTTKKGKAIQALRKSEEGLKKLGGQIRDKAKEIADKQGEKDSR